jgi:hypothetical protein
MGVNNLKGISRLRGIWDGPGIRNEFELAIDRISTAQ